MTTVNFGQVLKDAKSASFEALPVGDYDVEVTKAEAVTSSNGRPMIKVTFKVIVGPHTNRQVMNNFVLSVDSPVALSIFFRHMKCFGLEEGFFAALGEQGTLDPVANAMMGKRVRLQLSHRDWQGETRNEVKQVKPYTGAPGGMGGTPTAMTGVPGPSPAAYGATPTQGPSPIANTPAQVTQQYAAVAAAAAPTPTPAPVVTTPQPAPVAQPQVISEVAAQPEVTSPPAPPELPI